MSKSFRELYDIFYAADTIKEILSNPNLPQFDTVAVTGVSGMIGAVVARELNKHLLVVRKMGEPTRQRFCGDKKRETFPLVGTMGERFVIIDDEIYSGSTIRDILDAIKKNYGKYCGPEASPWAWEPSCDFECNNCDEPYCDFRSEDNPEAGVLMPREYYPHFVGVITSKPSRENGRFWTPEMLQQSFRIAWDWGGKEVE